MVRRKGQDISSPEAEVKRPRHTGPGSNSPKQSWVPDAAESTVGPAPGSPSRPKAPPPRPGLPVSGSDTARCAHWNCKTRKDGGYAALEGVKYCLKHKCEVPECPYQVQGSSKRCKGHGGGKRCVTEGCTKSAQGYTPHCNNHGGGKKCTAPECTKPARVRGGFCNAHSEAARCKIPGCQKYKQKNGFCISHFKAEEGKSADMLPSPSNSNISPGQQRLLPTSSVQL